MIIYVIIGSLITKSQNKKLETIANLYEISQDSLKLERNKYNQQTATVEVLQSKNTKLFTDLNIKDESISRLQKIIKQYEKKIGDLNTAIIISNQTIIKLQDSLRAIIIGYSENPETPGVFYPIYEREISTKWTSGRIIMGLDSLNLQLLNKNDYEVTVGNERSGMFAKKYYANITNLNPNTETTVMKVYQKDIVKTNTPKVFGIGAICGILISLLL